MAFPLRNLAFTITPPLLAASLLAGIVRENSHHVKPTDVEPYHAKAAQAVKSVPYLVGNWFGHDDDIPAAAQKLLRPNAILSRTYTYNEGGAANRRQHKASLLIVQCRDSRDMVGHYPPICYRAHGMTAERFAGCELRPEAGVVRTVQVAQTPIDLTEYRFTQLYQGQVLRTTVYNFFIVPKKHVVPDMKAVETAAEDYQQRYYGAAQFQVVFHSLASVDLSQAERDDIFATLMAPNLTLIQTLTSGGLQ
jgi:hypothetical protein